MELTVTGAGGGDSNNDYSWTVVFVGWKVAHGVMVRVRLG